MHPHSPFRDIVLLALLVTTLALPVVRAEEAAAKDFTIFVGMDIAVSRNGKYYRVIGAEKKALQVLLNHRVATVPLSESRNLRVDRGVKLTNLRANIANLQGDEGASQSRLAAEHDAMRNSMAMRDEAEDKMDKVLGETVWMAILSQKPAGGPTPANTADQVLQRALDQLPELTNHIDQAASLGNDLVTGRPVTGSELNDTGFVVSFVASGPVPLEECHVAVVADYTLPGEGGLVLSNVTLEPIGTLGVAARKIRVELRHFPPRAELKGYHVALYSRGQEIATNLSTRRTDITRDEAVLYLTLEHLAKHPGESLPPTPVLMVPRAEFVARLGSAPLEQVIYARVGKDGKILRLTSDAAGWVHLTPDLDSAVAQIAFVPALEKGKPIEGVAKLTLADLVASN